jgi:hypothetical protein
MSCPLRVSRRNTRPDSQLYGLSGMELGCMEAPRGEHGLPVRVVSLLGGGTNVIWLLYVRTYCNNDWFSCNGRRLLGGDGLQPRTCRVY